MALASEEQAKTIFLTNVSREQLYNILNLSCPKCRFVLKPGSAQVVAENGGVTETSCVINGNRPGKPLCLIALGIDHLAPWKIEDGSTEKGIQLRRTPPSRRLGG